MSDRLFTLAQEIARIRQQCQQGLSEAAAYDDNPQNNRLLALQQSLTSSQFGYGIEFGLETDDTEIDRHLTQELQPFADRASFAQNLIDENAVYVPWADPELREVAEKAIYALPKMHPKILTGKSKPLSQLSPFAKLYLLAHGHATLPKFVIKGTDGAKDSGSFTADELAEWMENDGFKKDHRDLELLVCHAGVSVGSLELVKKRQAIVAKWKKIQVSNISEQEKENYKQQINKEFMKLHQEPSPYISSDQTLPMSAQLVQALKNRGYTNIRVISYIESVLQNFGKTDPYDYLVDFYTNQGKGIQWGKGKVWIKINDKEVSGENYQKIWL
jgi:cellobiose-specific phosphotransferase system component IIB